MFDFEPRGIEGINHIFFEQDGGGGLVRDKCIDAAIEVFGD